MSSSGSLAELRLYTSDGEVFRAEDGEILADYPPVLSRLLSYWRSRCSGQAFPARVDIDPVDIPALLEHLILFDVLRDPLDFRYRLVGGHIVEHTGYSVQGRTMRGLIADGSPHTQAVQAQALVAGNAIAETEAPIFIDLVCGANVPEKRRHLQALLLPLGEPGEIMNMVLGGLTYLS